MRATPVSLTALLLTASTALAQTTAQTPSPAPDAATGGIGDYWWLIVVVVLVAPWPSGTSHADVHGSEGIGWPPSPPRSVQSRAPGAGSLFGTPSPASTSAVGRPRRSD
jgi:hypothetical protein